MDALLTRRSVRKYDLTKKINYEELLDLCRFAEAAPSAKNQKGRAYIIVDDENIIKSLSTVSKNASFLMNCNTLIAIVGLEPETLRSPRLHSQDLAAATENLLIAATSKGFGSCWIGITPIEERMTICDEILKLDSGVHTFSLIALGYPLEENCFYDAKKLTSSMIHHNKYKNA